MAKVMQRPFYVAVESYKFARLYPLSQRDIVDLSGTGVCSGLISDVGRGGGEERVEAADFASIDFTPAEYITLMFTDLGILTPAAVSDELIRLYQ